tara:strand:- start:793 stop:1212 length:420 start_codon:yes stop_codon:yes gene_type:complete
MIDQISVDDVDAILAEMNGFQPCAWYNEESDQLSFLAENVQYGTRRVDGLITLFIDLHTKGLVGFKLKGFKALYQKVCYGLDQSPNERALSDLVAFLDELFWMQYQEANEFRSERAESYLRARNMAKGFKTPPPVSNAA